MAVPKITSSYLILDVEKWRKALAKHLAKHGAVKATVEVLITDAYGRDDGVSIEFNCNVLNITPQESA